MNPETPRQISVAALAASAVHARPELPTGPESLDSLQEKLLSVIDTLQCTLQRTNHLIAHIDQDIVPEMTSSLRSARQAMDAQEPSWRSSNGNPRPS